MVLENHIFVHKLIGFFYIEKNISLFQEFYGNINYYLLYFILADGLLSECRQDLIAN